MKRIKIILTLIFVLSLSLLNSCRDDDEVKEVYLEGEPIPGIEIYFPSGYYSTEELMPKISPDGKKLLFSGPPQLPEWRGLWLLDLDTHQRTLLHPIARVGDWAPDSEWIVFNIRRDLFKMKIDGTGLTQLTFNGNSYLADWSPEGEKIAFHGITYVEIMTTDGTVTEYLHGAGGFPDWKPDGSAIIGFKGFSNPDIWKKLTVYDLNFNEVTQTLDACIHQDNRFPRYSPDSKRITFINPRGIWIMDANGEGLKRIIPNHIYNDYTGRKDLWVNTPSWFPDGQHIIYENFKITKSERTGLGWRVEGVIRFYKVNVDEAAAFSNLH